MPKAHKLNHPSRVAIEIHRIATEHDVMTTNPLWVFDSVTNAWATGPQTESVRDTAIRHAARRAIQDRDIALSAAIQAVRDTQKR